MKTRIALSAALTAAALSQAVSAAAPVITVNQSNLQPLLANQQVQILITGTDQIAGADLYFQLDALSGPAPIITNLNLLSGTIFSANNTGEKGKFIGTGTLSNFASVGTTTASGT